MENQGDPKVWWKIIDRVTEKGSHTAIPVLQREDGSEAETSEEKAEVLNALFVEKATIDDANVEVPVVPPRTARSVSRVKFRARKVLRLLRSLKVKQATVPDGIPARVLKECAEVLAPVLSSLFQLSFDTGVCPAAWKIAHVVAIFKHKGSTSDPAMYRPHKVILSLGASMDSGGSSG